MAEQGKEIVMRNTNVFSRIHAHWLMAMLLIPGGALAQTWTQIGQDVDGEAAGDESGFSVSMPDASTLAVGAWKNDDAGSDAGHVRVYSRIGNVWQQKGSDLDGVAAEDLWGRSVSMPDANTLAIGAYGNDSLGPDQGHSRVYTWDGSAWIQKGTDLFGENAWDMSGFAVCMPDPNTVAIGAIDNGGNGPSSGHVRVHTWDGSAWVQKGMDLDGEAAGDWFGRAVSMPDDNTIAIGAPLNDGTGTDAGHARVFEWNGGAWVQKGIDLDAEAAGDGAGFAVSMPDPNTVAIGAVDNDGNGTSAGHVRVFLWNGTGWIQKGADLDGEAADDWFGRAVCMPDANTLAVGAPYNGSSDAGHVRIFEWSGSAWVQIWTDVNGEASFDYAGFSLSMPNAQTLDIGAIGNDANGSGAGQARVFGTMPMAVQEPNGRGWSATPNPTTGLFTLRPLKDNGPATLVITGTLGQEVERMELDPSNTEYTFSLDGPSGPYTVWLFHDHDPAEKVIVIKE
ncbi:MAG: hypothetical protein WAU70_04910 [Flavobacteriales bacterium]